MLRYSWHTDEVATLVDLAAEFASYFASRPASLLTRVYGVYSMKLYSRSFYFVVLSNVSAVARGETPLVYQMYTAAYIRCILPYQKRAARHLWYIRCTQHVSDEHCCIYQICIAAHIRCTLPYQKRAVRLLCCVVASDTMAVVACC